MTWHTICSDYSNWGEPEGAPHRSVVDVGGTSVAYPTIYATSTVIVGGTSVACLTIYTTYTVVGWWCERRMADNLHYIHGVWLVVRPTIYFTNMEATVSWTRS